VPKTNGVKMKFTAKKVLGFIIAIAGVIGIAIKLQRISIIDLEIYAILIALIVLGYEWAVH